MSFVASQDALREELRRRVDAGELTGMELARLTGFTQAHISNFINRKRGLKLGALDRTLRALGLTLYDLLDPHELARFAAVPAGSSAEVESVPVVSAAAAAVREVIVTDEVAELVPLRRALLEKLRADLVNPAHRPRTRFVLLRAEPKDAAAMWPRWGPGALLLLDRHYTSLRPYRKELRNVYAVAAPPGCLVRYVEYDGANLILRPHNPDEPAQVLRLAPGADPSARIIGRIACIVQEI